MKADRSRRRKQRPNYCKHSSGKGFVWCGRKAIYFPGLHNSPESLEAYANYCRRLLGETPPPPTPSELTVLLLLHRFSKEKLPKLKKSEHSGYRRIIKIVGELFGDAFSADFGPLKLQKVREVFTQQKIGKNPEKQKNWTRTHVNKQVRRLIKIFKWGVSKELVPASQWHALEAVEPLKAGESEARESEAVKPVSWEHVQATMAHTSPTVAAMIELHWLTGMRSSNLCDMRTCDIDRSGDVWVYIPAKHKTAWKKRHLFIPLGPRAQAILFQFIHSREPEEFLFSPRDTGLWRSYTRWENRKSPRWLSAQAKRGRKHSRYGAKYKSRSYRQAVLYAIAKAEIPDWTPHQLRHSRATEIRSQFGAEAAQVSLGHASLNATQIYAERDMELARKVARALG